MTVALEQDAPDRVLEQTMELDSPDEALELDAPDRALDVPARAPSAPRRSRRGPAQAPDHAPSAPEHARRESGHGRRTRVFHLADEHEHAEGESTLLGFWIYLMSDCLLFAALFATFGVLGGSYAGGPSAREVLELPTVALNTAMLLLSSLTCGFAMLEVERGRAAAMQGWLAVTALFGLAFVGIEIHEFVHMVAEGAGPDRSAFLSSFFALVGTHGLHVSVGLIWLGTLVTQVRRHGLSPANTRRLACFSLFWHFLDVIWIGVFTFVYLMGMLR
jgi:cytochrome o ubiquinol oxidase subunit III